MKKSLAAATAAILPALALAEVTVFNSQASFEAVAGPTEALITSARQVALSNEVGTPPGANSAVGSLLTFDRENTRLARSFVLEALEGAGMTFDDDEPSDNSPLFDFALSIGDIGDAQDDDWEVRLLDNAPPMRAFGVVFRDNTFEPGETLFLLDQAGAVLDQVDLAGNPQTLDDFVGVVTDFDFFGVRFDEDSGADDMAIADLRFAVPDATWTAMTPHVSSLQPLLVPLNDGRLLRTPGVTLGAPSLFSRLAGTWAQTGPLADGRRPDHAASLLHTGRVLLSGGVVVGSAAPQSFAAVFSPRSNQWSSVAKMNQPRFSHPGITLADGRVLVSGGAIGFDVTASAELFDPVTGTWTPTANLAVARALHAAALLDDGRVLVVGGLGGAADVRVTETEIYDPASGTWSMTGSLNVGRFNHVLQRLNDGRILTTAGLSEQDAPSAEIYDPQTGQWTPVAAPDFKQYTGMVLLPDGRALVGGHVDNRVAQPMQIYDPQANAWQPAAEPIETGDLEGSNMRFSRMPDGRVLYVDSSGTARVYTERQLTRTMAEDGPAVSLHTATLLASGEVLVAGGRDTELTVQSAASRFNAQTRQWTPTASMLQARRDHTATLLADGRVLATGGFSDAALTAAEVYDPASAGAWSATGMLNTARSLHTASLLGDGRVAVIGGLAGASATRSVEVWDPQSDSWSEVVDCLPNARQRHTATTLHDGRVLVVGGLVSNTPSPLAAIFDPASNTCAAAAPMAEPRSLHSATLLVDGRVLVAGGRRDDTVARHSVEIYDPVTDQWSQTAPLGTPRKEHVASVLPGGRVLVTGGRDRKNTLLSGAEIYDPVSSRWYGVTALGTARRNHRAIVLFDGRVLIHGGFSGLASTELLNLDRGFPDSRRPVISSVAAVPAADDALAVSGTGFSVGATTDARLVDPREPMLVIRRLDNDAYVTLAVDPLRGWSATRFNARPDPRLVGGPVLVSVWSAGVPSAPVYRVLGPALRLFADGFED